MKLFVVLCTVLAVGVTTLATPTVGEEVSKGKKKIALLNIHVFFAYRKKL